MSHKDSPQVGGLDWAGIQARMRAEGWIDCAELAFMLNEVKAYPYTIDKVMHLFVPLHLLGATITWKYNGRYPVKRWIFLPPGVFELLVEVIVAKRVLDAVRQSRSPARWKTVIEGVLGRALKEEVA